MDRRNVLIAGYGITAAAVMGGLATPQGQDALETARDALDGESRAEDRLEARLDERYDLPPARDLHLGAGWVQFEDGDELDAPGTYEHNDVNAFVGHVYDAFGDCGDRFQDSVYLGVRQGPTDVEVAAYNPGTGSADAVRWTAGGDYLADLGDGIHWDRVDDSYKQSEVASLLGGSA